MNNSDMQIPFNPRQSAHCETGVLSNLLGHYGLNVSESMVFGIGSGLFFGYFPFIRLNRLPLTALRARTGSNMQRAVKRGQERKKPGEARRIGVDEKAAAKKKIDKVRLEEIVADLLDKGDIYEPELGMMKRI